MNLRRPSTSRLDDSHFDHGVLKDIYLRQVNEVNGGDNAFVCVCLSVCVCVCARSGRSWELNDNSSKTVKATDFKLDTHVRRDNPDKTSKNFPKRGRGHGHVTP